MKKPVAILLKVIASLTYVCRKPPFITLKASYRHFRNPRDADSHPKFLSCHELATTETRKTASGESVR